MGLSSCFQRMILFVLVHQISYNEVIESEVITMNDLDANAYSTILSFLSLLASTVTSIIAIRISVKTLKQNNKMIEESTRPVVGIYSKYTDGILYIVMKNFGNSPCVIDNIETDMNISEEESQTIHGNPYLKAKGATLPPNGKMIRSESVGIEKIR